MQENKYKCKLCNKYYLDSEMSEEHYPARCVGNEEIVTFDITKLIELSENQSLTNEILNRITNGESIESVCGDIFDNKLSKPLYYKGRTARTLCRTCNTLIGKYDEAYLKFF